MFWFFFATQGLVCPAGEALLGPVEEVSVLDDFTTNSQAAWSASSGGNVSFKLACGRNIPGVADSVMQIDFQKKNGQETSATQNWLSLKRPVQRGSVGTAAEGLRLLLGSPTGGEWWINVSLRIGNETYSHAIQPTLPARMVTEHLIPFAELKAGGQPLSREQVASVEGLELALSVNGPSVCLDRLATYRRQKYNSWLAFVSSHPENNIYEPGQSVIATLTPGGTWPADAKAFRYEVRDFFEQVAASGRFTLNAAPNYKLNLTPKEPGYYELTAYWLDDKGRDLEKRSCILTEGSLPAGTVTFAVMPRTVAQNLERFRALGSKAFLGLHGDFLGLADLIGLNWRFEYSRWPWLEPQKPDRSNGLAPWAADWIRKEPPRPVYRPHILPFCGNFAGPAWAANKPGLTPPYARWEDYLAMVRDYVAVEKHLYPGMAHRVYGVAWEVNLNMPPSNFAPPYTPADIVELHRRAREVIKAADPKALVIGPCPSNLNPQWFELVFKAGVLDYVDGLESHGYTEGSFTPEENDYPGKLATIRDLMRQYNHGKVLPIYITEAGFRGILGSRIIHRTHAQVMTRLAIILKGEGVEVFLPFYGIDYDREDYGLCFNLEVDGPNPWGTKRISPKPAVNAFATCAGLLEGAKPVRRVKIPGEDVWTYLFDREGTSILAAWSPNGTKNVSLPVSNTGSVEAVDTIGHSSHLPVRGSRIELILDPSPKYLLGIKLSL